MLGLPYKEKYRYLNKLKNDWKSNHENKQGSNCSSVHGWRGWCFVPYFVSCAMAVKVGWLPTKSKNRWLLWKDSVGRVEWFETGKAMLYIRSPVNMGRLKQLLCNGFFKTGLINDIELVERITKNIRFKEAHYVFETGHRLPKGTIDYFAKSNGLTIKVGDTSHPKAVEVISRVPDWVDNLNMVLQEFRLLWNTDDMVKEALKKPDYIV
jgi:hypothetical protein